MAGDLDGRKYDFSPITPPSPPSPPLHCQPQKKSKIFWAERIRRENGVKRRRNENKNSKRNRNRTTVKTQDTHTHAVYVCVFVLCVVSVFYCRVCRLPNLFHFVSLALDRACTSICECWFIFFSLLRRRHRHRRLSSNKRNQYMCSSVEFAATKNDEISNKIK